MSSAFTTLTAQLAAARVPHRLHTHAPMRTVQDAIALGFPPEQLLKTVVFKSKAGAWYLVAMRGQDQANYKLLAAVTGVKRADLIRPAPDEVQTMLGFEPGAVGPLAPSPV
jgi:prolyl-tRNA editing enzyme YbaK/EbsC (Cys-tRNA(Pro) deacylase)